jgi:hypothetical protein
MRDIADNDFVLPSRMTEDDILGLTDEAAESLLAIEIANYAFDHTVLRADFKRDRL